MASQFGDDRSQRLGRVRGLAYWAADHQVVGAGSQGLARGENTALVILGNLVADLVYAAIDPRVRHS